MASRLELAAGKGDQTLGRTKFVIRRVANAVEARAELAAGFRFALGQPVVSGCLVPGAGREATEQTGDRGVVLVCALRPNFHLGYGIFTSAYVDRTSKSVLGAPLRYASARNQLGFYAEPDTETARLHLEAEVANGYTLDQRPNYVFDVRHIIGVFEPAETLAATVRQVEVAVGGLQPVDFDHIGESLRQIFRPAASVNTMLAEPAVRDLLTSTVESMVLSQLRMLRWRGLAYLGYSFLEDGKPVAMTAAASADEQRRSIDEFERHLASSALFNGELAWMKDLAARQLELMRIELDGTELESAPE